MSTIEEALCPYIPAASLDVFYNELPRAGDRDFPIGFELWYLHTPISTPNKILMKCVCVGRDATSAKWKVVHQTEV